MPARFTMRFEYEKCRTWGHAWEDFIPQKRGSGWGMRFYLRCVRCATERHDVVDSLGDLAERKYVYPDDYRLSADETPTRAQLRLDLLKDIRGQARARRNGKKAG